MSLDREIASWDGKSSSDIEEIYTRHCDGESLFTEAIELCHEERLQSGATWILKRHLECGKRLDARESMLLVNHLPRLKHWEARLHVLQCLPYMEIGISEKKSVEAFLRKNLVDENKFVRAWAYNGFHVISVQHPEYQKEAKQIFEVALRDEAPSVKARIRNVING